MSVKMGRPKSDNPLSVVLKARIDVETNNRLSQYCSKHGCNITDVIRKGIEIVLEDESRGK